MIKRSKFFILLLILTTVMFFSSDFEVINIEKTAIITAIAVDKVDDKYEVTAQIAVPEATDINSENKNALISGIGGTVAGAIKNIGNESGWHPKLSFCNLIAIGKEIYNDNIIKVVDYFVKTLKIQDSALLVLAEDKAKDLMKATSPMDNISSFAIQKILLKDPGFDRDICAIDLKSFTEGHYSYANSYFVPIIKTINAEDRNSSGGKEGTEQKNQNTKDNLGASGQTSGTGGGGSGSSLSTEGKNIFDATTTALFKNGKIVGTLQKDETRALNLITSKAVETGFETSVVDENLEKTRYFLLKILRNTYNLKLNIENNKPKLYINLDIYCKVADRTVISDADYSDSTILPASVKNSAQNMLKENLTTMMEKYKQTGCDFLGLDKLLYRYNHKYYEQFKDKLTSLEYFINVNVSSQK